MNNNEAINKNLFNNGQPIIIERNKPNLEYFVKAFISDYKNQDTKEKSAS